MKWRITYKEFSIVLGILVALIIMALTLWIQPVTDDSGAIPKKLLPQASSTRIITAKVIKLIQASFL